MKWIDEDMEDTGGDAPQISQESEPVVGSTSQNETSPAPIVVSGGRRRGRRKIMKKRTTKDDEGYLGLYYEVIIHIDWEVDANMLSV